MRDFPSCFGESGVQIADSSSSTSSRAAQNLVTCVYQCHLQGILCFITVTWTRNLMGLGLCVAIEDSNNHCLCKVDIKPWLFSKRKGFKNLEVDSASVIDIYWDLTSARFGSGPEPLDGFYLAVVFKKEIILLLGDLEKEAYKKVEANPSASDAIFIARREHIFGRKFYGAKARFWDGGQTHNITIECDTMGINDPCLIIRIDSKQVMQVKRLRWKFRGNHTILVDGLPVEVYWDVHSWLFGNVMSYAVFLFQACFSAAAEAAEKTWACSSQTDPCVLSSWSSPSSSKPLPVPDSQSQPLGFSLVLYAWKHE